MDLWNVIANFAYAMKRTQKRKEKKWNPLTQHWHGWIYIYSAIRRAPNTQIFYTIIRSCLRIYFFHSHQTCRFFFVLFVCTEKPLQMQFQIQLIPTHHSDWAERARVSEKNRFLLLFFLSFPSSFWQTIAEWKKNMMAFFSAFRLYNTQPSERKGVRACDC